MIDLAGGYLLEKYCTLEQLLSVVYSEFEWISSKFNNGGRLSIYEDSELASYFVEWLHKDIDAVKYLNKQMSVKGFKEYSVLVTLLKKEFPNFKWTSKYKDPFTKKSQFLLKECLKKLFPSEGKIQYF